MRTNSRNRNERSYNQNFHDSYHQNNRDREDERFRDQNYEERNRRHDWDYEPRGFYDHQNSWREDNRENYNSYGPSSNFGRHHSSDYYNDDRSYERNQNRPYWDRENFSSQGRNDDRNFFERASDRIEQNRNEWTGRNDREEDNHPYFNNHYREPDYRRERDRYEYDSYSEPRNSGTYKGRYYGRHQTIQDKRDIKRCYEESQRNSNWSSAYLPMTNQY